jgi:hypothetical protein
MGTENAKVKRVFGDRNIQGPSTRNSRIERLWRDLFDQVVISLKNKVTDISEAEQLSLDRQDHLWLIRHCALPFVQRRLDEFADAYNHKKIRTAQSRTPLQMWEIFPEHLVAANEIPPADIDAEDVQELGEEEFTDRTDGEVYDMVRRPRRLRDIVLPDPSTFPDLETACHEVVQAYRAN